MVGADIYIVCSAGFGFSLFDIFLLLPAFKVGDFLRPCVLTYYDMSNLEMDGWFSSHFP